MKCVRMCVLVADWIFLHFGKRECHTKFEFSYILVIDNAARIGDIDVHRIITKGLG